MEFPHEASSRYTQFFVKAEALELKAKKALNDLKSSESIKALETESKFFALAEQCFALHFHRDEKDEAFRYIELYLDLLRGSRNKHKIEIMLVNEERPFETWHLKHEKKLQKYINELYASTGFKGMTAEQLGTMIAVKFKELTKK